MISQLWTAAPSTSPTPTARNSPRSKPSPNKTSKPPSSPRSIITTPNSPTPPIPWPPLTTLITPPRQHRVLRQLPKPEASSNLKNTLSWTISTRFGKTGSGVTETHLIINLLKQFESVPIQPEIEAETIQIKRKYRIKLPDAIIAATALQQSARLVTRNTNDFNQISALELCNPFAT